MHRRSLAWLLAFCAGSAISHRADLFAQQSDPFVSVVRTTEPLSPKAEQATFRLPDGFDIQLVAAEPDILKPINMAFDARGRLWISDSTEYPIPVPVGEAGRDSIKILEDTNGDGQADKITTFADGLNIPIGLIPYGSGVIAYSIPNIWYFEDTNGDGVSDKRTKLYGPMGFERDTHGMNNAFRRGFDGWIYACHGFNNETTVKGADGHEVQMQSGNTFRFRPDGSRIEHFTWGQVNPFGMTFDPLGNLFSADCHSKPVYQLLRNGYYPSFGKPHDGLGFVAPMMDHTHGSTAIAGLTFFSDTTFPPKFRGNLFSGNVMTSRINRNHLEYHGSTIRAKEEPDFLSSSDPWFRPVDLQLGQDGAIYIADFYNRIIGHYEVPLTHEGRDRKRGRIWKVRYLGNLPEVAGAPRVSVASMSMPNLIQSLAHPNLTRGLLALDRLTDDVGIAAAPVLAEAFGKTDNARLRSLALWALYRLDRLTPAQIAAAAADPHREPRIHAMKVLAEMPIWTDALRTLAVKGLDDSDAFVARAAADALGRHPVLPQIEPLLSLLARVPEGDNHLNYVVRQSLRDHLAAANSLEELQQIELTNEQSQIIAEIALAIPSVAAGDYLVSYLSQHRIPKTDVSPFLLHAARYAGPRSAGSLANYVREQFADDLEAQLNLFNVLQSGLTQRGVALDRPTRAWGVELLTTIFESSAENQIGWTNVPFAQATADPWTIQQRVSSDGNQDGLFFSSLPRGEKLTGINRSGTFSIPEKLEFFLAGHIGPPNEPVHARNFVRLRAAGSHRILKEVTPPRNDIAQKITWDLTEWQGTNGYLELVDGDTRSGYAWLAAGRFSLAGLNPSREGHRRQLAAELAGQLQLSELRPLLTVRLLDDHSDAAVRGSIATALVRLEPDSRLAALVPLISEPSLAESFRVRIIQSVQDRNAAAIGALLNEVMQSIPERMQATVAESLASDRQSAEILLELITQGKTSPHVLRQPVVRQKLLAAKVPDAQARIDTLTANLPSEADALRKLIAERQQEFLAAQPSMEAGALVFAKTCAACHQIGGKGALIGPQLDGIGQRGLERLLEDVLDPNRNVDVAFRVTVLALTDGQVRTGLFRRLDGAMLVLVDAKGQEFRVPKDKVDEQITSNLSLMPANVSEIVPAGDFHNLIAYLLAQKAKPQISEDPAQSE